MENLNIVKITGNLIDLLYQDFLNDLYLFLILCNSLFTRKFGKFNCGHYNIFGKLKHQH